MCKIACINIIHICDINLALPFLLLALIIFILAEFTNYYAKSTTELLGDNSNIAIAAVNNNDTISNTQQIPLLRFIKGKLPNR